MRGNFGDANVEGFEPLLVGLELPDPDDRHVLAAAIHGGAQSIVTGLEPRRCDACIASALLAHV